MVSESCKTGVYFYMLLAPAASLIVPLPVLRLFVGVNSLMVSYFFFNKINTDEDIKRLQDKVHHLDKYVWTHEKETELQMRLKGTNDDENCQYIHQLNEQKFDIRKFYRELLDNPAIVFGPPTEEDSKSRDTNWVSAARGRPAARASDERWEAENIINRGI